jgi:MFS family permease
MTTTALPEYDARKRPMTAEERKVIIASSAGTIFEWYDFYLYGSLAAVIGAQFFSAYPEATRNVFALLAFAAGFLVRPFGALFFGRLGDMIGRKATFLITILIMGLSTFLVGCLPSYEWFSSIGAGWMAPTLLIVLRILQGLALGGEYGGAAIYVAEHAPQNQRGYFTAYIQTTATLGLLLSLIVIMFTQIYVNANYPMAEQILDGVVQKAADGKPVMIDAFKQWGWRVPFLVSIFLLLISLYIRLQMSESPAFKKMKEEGANSKAPLSEAFGPPRNALVLLIAPLLFIAAYSTGMLTGTLAAIIGVIFVVVGGLWSFFNAKIAGLALVGLVAGQAVVWYTGQFYALFFLQNILKVDNFTANVLIAWSLTLGTGFFLVFGALSDRIGRKPIILAGCAVAALTLFPIFGLMTQTATPGLHRAQQTTKVIVLTDLADCSFQFNPTGTVKFTNPCDIAKSTLARSGVNYTTQGAPAGTVATVKVGDFEPISAKEKDFAKILTSALEKTDYAAAKVNEGKVQIKIDPKAGLANFAQMFNIFDAQKLTLIGLLTILVIYVTMVYGPMAAALVELFPTRIRYSGMSLPYHIGNGWFGGLLPATSFAMVAQTGDIYFGLWYPVVIALMTLVIGALFVPETHKRDIFKY